MWYYSGQPYHICFTSILYESSNKVTSPLYPNETYYEIYMCVTKLQKDANGAE
jgi:hypothetical protein